MGCGLLPWVAQARSFQPAEKAEGKWSAAEQVMLPRANTALSTLLAALSTFACLH